jgi:glycosyltransferase involved in cell wall biosynthesis
MVTEPGPPADGVRYFTGLPECELAELYRTAWVFASPSVYEGFGLPYLEAMASGTPVVATPNPGSEEVLDGGRYGRLVDDSGFAPAILALLEDPRARALLTAAGLERSRELSIDRAIAQYDAAIRELVPHPRAAEVCA